MYMHNKKAFQSKANRPLVNRCMVYIVKKLEQVWAGAGDGKTGLVGGGVGVPSVVTGPCVVTWGSPVNRQT